MKNQFSRILTTCLLVSLPAFAQGQSRAQGSAVASPRAQLKATLKEEIKSPSPRGQWGVGMGISDLLYAQYQRPISLRHYFGVSAGYLPLMLASESLRSEQEKRMNERFNVVLVPKAHAVSLGVFHGYRASRNFSFESKAALLLINVGGTANMKSQESGHSTSVAELDVTAYVPIVSLNAVYSISRMRAWNLEIGAGVNVVAARSIQTQVAGKMPSLLDVAPEYRASLVDGRQEMERDLNEAIDRLPFQKTFLPSIFLRGTW